MLHSMQVFLLHTHLSKVCMHVRKCSTIASGKIIQKIALSCNWCLIAAPLTPRELAMRCGLVFQFPERYFLGGSLQEVCDPDCLCIHVTRVLVAH